ncbi:MAG TPA: hypothetical protein PK637_03505 [Flavobacteriales bacterium]|nr:hypothetical protein [Flavobacteriales bacterium]HRE75368.1 hypothetical protein [Flavobacteriales bacterium]HRE95804.1 hypothetical protein [Flavobacteriales bacterium]HRJ37572.1 hypothetical protein [Flavobacteriales bacterium]
MERWVIFLFPLVFLFSCKTPKTIGPEFTRNKSVIGVADSYAIDANDSIVIRISVFGYSRRHDFYWQQAACLQDNYSLFVYTEYNILVQQIRSYKGTYTLKLPMEKFILRIEQDGYRTFVLHTYELKRNYLYLMEVYMKKGNGVDKWVI